jgi:hypothetical protein
MQRRQCIVLQVPPWLDQMENFSVLGSQPYLLWTKVSFLSKRLCCFFHPWICPKIHLYEGMARIIKYVPYTFTSLQKKSGANDHSCQPRKMYLQYRAGKDSWIKKTKQKTSVSNQDSRKTSIIGPVDTCIKGRVSRNFLALFPQTPENSIGVISNIVEIFTEIFAGSCKCSVHYWR